MKFHFELMLHWIDNSTQNYNFELNYNFYSVQNCNFELNCQSHAENSSWNFIFNQIISGESAKVQINCSPLYG